MWNWKILNFRINEFYSPIENVSLGQSLSAFEESFYTKFNIVSNFSFLLFEKLIFYFNDNFECIKNSVHVICKTIFRSKTL